jgi:superfamily I DNA and/or RNA helicase
MEQFKEYLEAISIAFSKMEEFRKGKDFFEESIDAEFCSDQEHNPIYELVLVKEFLFPSPKTFVIYSKTILSSSAKILLIKNSYLSGLQIIFDKENSSFFFEIGMNTNKDITPFIHLKKNNILPSLEVFQALFPLRKMEVAEMLSCDGFGCDG